MLVDVSKSIQPLHACHHPCLSSDRQINPLLFISNSSSLLDGVEQSLGRLLAVALRVVLGPLPQVLARLLECLLGLPVELRVGARRVGRQVEHITGAASDHLVRQVAADGVAESLDHVEDGAALAGAQVEGGDAGLLLAQVVQRDQVAAREVLDVDVVTDGGAVVRLVVFRIVSFVH